MLNPFLSWVFELIANPARIAGFITNLSIITLCTYCWAIFLQMAQILTPPFLPTFLPYYPKVWAFYLHTVLTLLIMCINNILIFFIRLKQIPIYGPNMSLGPAGRLNIILTLIMCFNLFFSCLVVSLSWDGNMGGSFRSSWTMLTSVDPFSGVAYSMVEPLVLTDLTGQYNLITMPFREYIWIHCLINLQSFFRNRIYRRARRIGPVEIINGMFVLYIFICLGTLGLQGTLTALEPLFTLLRGDFNPLQDPIGWVRAVSNALSQFIRVLLIHVRVPNGIQNVQVILDALPEAEIPAALIGVVRPEIPVDGVPSVLTYQTIFLTILYYVVSAIVFNRLGGHPIPNPPNPILISNDENTKKNIYI